MIAHQSTELGIVSLVLTLNVSFTYNRLSSFQCFL